MKARFIRLRAHNFLSSP